MQIQITSYNERSRFRISISSDYWLGVAATAAELDRTLEIKNSPPQDLHLIRESQFPASDVCKLDTF